MISQVSFALGFFKIDSEALKDAGINTIVGLLVVFVALVFISFIISLFKYINRLEQKMRKNEKAAATPAVNKAAAITGSELNIDNFELTAIITAAINEYEESQGHTFKNGIVVRSIKKLN